MNITVVKSLQGRNCKSATFSNIFTKSIPLENLYTILHWIVTVRDESWKERSSTWVDGY